MRALALTLVLASSFALAACSSSSAAPDGSGSGKGAPGAAPAGGAKVITIAKLGLKGTAAGETEEPMMGSGDPIMIMASTFTLTLSEAKTTDPKTIKNAQDIAAGFNATNIQTETLPDGWAVTYQNKGGDLGPNFFVSVRREIGGKGYLCETMQNNTDQQKAALAFCKSLTK